MSDEHSIYKEPSQTPEEVQKLVNQRKAAREQMQEDMQQDLRNTEVDEHSVYYQPHPPPSTHEQVQEILKRKRVMAKLDHSKPNFLGVTEEELNDFHQESRSAKKTDEDEIRRHAWEWAVSDGWVSDSIDKWHPRCDI